MATAIKESFNMFGVSPLSQSKQSALACESFYGARYIDDAPDIPSEPARRGTEIHAAISRYVAHLTETRQPTDYEYIRALASECSAESREILETFCESFIFDSEAVLAIETRLAMDKDFNPVEAGSDEAAYEGTPDLTTMESETAATIWDWKSFFNVVDADTFQAKLYPLMLFQSNPALRSVRFVLFFVRYGASRDVTWNRSDVPRLKEIAHAEKNRQIALHIKSRAREKLTASPGRHCAWCPLLSGACPLSNVNPYLKLKPDQRLMQTVWLQKAYEFSLGIIKDLVVETGPIECRDDNGTLLRADFRPKTSRSYSFNQTLPVLTEWAKDHPGDGAMIEGLTVGGLSSPIKAKKRAELCEKLYAIADVRVSTELKVGPAKDEEEAA